MQVIQGPRAVAILYNLLKSRGDARPWLLPANICPIVPITFLKAAVPFELIDISATTLHMDLEQAEAEIQKRAVGGILYAHTYGEPSTPEAFFQRLKQLDETILIVDDRCLCVPEIDPINSVADVQLFSTGYAKLVELGFGGYAFLKADVSYGIAHLPFDADAPDRLEQSYKQALKTRSFFDYHDSNWLQTEAALPAWDDYRAQIYVELERSLRQREQLNALYASHLPPELQLPELYQTWRFNLRVPDKEQVLGAIFRAGLFASSHYASLGGILSPSQCAQAENLHAGMINLFNDHHFDEARAEQVCRVILENLS